MRIFSSWKVKSIDDARIDDVQISGKYLDDIRESIERNFA